LHYCRDLGKSAFERILLTLTSRGFQDKSFPYVLRDWRQRGIDHEGVQSIKTAERLGLLTMEVQAFLWMMRRQVVFGAAFPIPVLP
jgi:hypothetical protein